MVSKKVKNLSFLGKKQTWYWEKGWLLLIGNGAEIWRIEKDRKRPGNPGDNEYISLDGAACSLLFAYTKFFKSTSTYKYQQNPTIFDIFIAGLIH